MRVQVHPRNSGRRNMPVLAKEDKVRAHVHGVIMGSRRMMGWCIVKFKEGVWV
jgi:hypothetical protein